MARVFMEQRCPGGRCSRANLTKWLWSSRTRRVQPGRKSAFTAASVLAPLAAWAPAPCAAAWQRATEPRARCGILLPP